MSDVKTITSILGAVSTYPIPLAALQNAAEGAGLAADTEVTQEVRQSAGFKRAMASIYEYLSIAPNISQGGVSFTFTSAERSYFAKKAASLLAEAGDSGISGYGWQGEDF